MGGGDGDGRLKDGQTTVTSLERTVGKPTLVKTNISSSHTGSKEFPLDVLVLYFLFVSVGSPNMSTSTYTPTFLSVKNWPEITWWVIGAHLAERGAKEEQKPQLGRNLL